MTKNQKLSLPQRDELLRQKFLKPREEIVEDGDKIHFKSSVDAEPIIDAVNMIGSLQRSRRTSDGRMYLGSLDPVTAAMLSRECGAAIGTKEFAKYAISQMKSGRLSKFLVDRDKAYY